VVASESVVVWPTFRLASLLCEVLSEWSKLSLLVELWLTSEAVDRVTAVFAPRE
jgi:hypothetical protein